MVIVRGEGVGYHELKAAMRALMLPVKWLDKSWVSVVSRRRFLCLQSCTLPMLEWPENVLRWIRKADVLEAMRSYGHSPDDAPWQIRCDDFQWFGPFPCPVKSYRICGAHQTLDNFALYMASWLPTSFVKSCQILIIEKKHHNIHNSQPKLCKSKRKWNLNLLHHPAVGIVPTASLPPVAKTHRHTHTQRQRYPRIFSTTCDRLSQTSYLVSLSHWQSLMHISFKFSWHLAGPIFPNMFSSVLLCCGHGNGGKEFSIEEYWGNWLRLSDLGFQVLDFKAFAQILRRKFAERDPLAAMLQTLLGNWCSDMSCGFLPALRWFFKKGNREGERERDLKPS